MRSLKSRATEYFGSRGLAPTETREIMWDVTRSIFRFACLEIPAMSSSAWHRSMATAA